MQAVPGRSGRVVVVGQLARDLVLRVSRVPAAGGTQPATQRLEMLGGKGSNQAVGMAELGMSVSLVAAAGDDETGSRLLQQAAADGIDTAWVTRSPGVPTGLIVSIVDDEGWRYLEYLPPAVLIGVPHVEAAEPAFRAAGTVAVQLQQPADTALAAAMLGRRHGCRVVLDGAPSDPASRDALLATADVVRADNHEAELLAGYPIRGGVQAVDAGREILRHGP